MWQKVDKHIKDQDHLTEKYRGPAHNMCNLQYCIKPKDIKILCIMQKLRSYDVHNIMGTGKPWHGDISVIPDTDERYTSIKIGEVTIIDSFQFKPSSLKSLSKDLGNDQYQEMMRYPKYVHRDNISSKNYIIKITKLSM